MPKVAPFGDSIRLLLLANGAKTKNEEKSRNVRNAQTQSLQSLDMEWSLNWSFLSDPEFIELLLCEISQLSNEMEFFL